MLHALQSYGQAATQALDSENILISRNATWR